MVPFAVKVSAVRVGGVQADFSVIHSENSISPLYSQRNLNFVEPKV